MTAPSGRRDSPDHLPPEEIQRVIHELRVHQIELEAQNEELRRAREALEASRERYFELYDRAPVGYLTLSEDSSILEANLAAAALVGTSKAAMMGRPLTAFVVPDDQDVFYRFWRALFGDGPPYPTELRLKRPVGTVIWVRIEARVVDAGGTTPTCCAVLIDTSELRQGESERLKLEARLVQSQRLESVGRLAGGVAHDFNNMLTVMLGSARLVQDALPPDSPLSADIREIQRAGERAANLTSQLLAFARRQPVAPQSLDLNVVVSRTIAMLQRLIGEQIILDWVPADRLPRVRMDRSQIDHLLANVVVNARDAIADVGRITIATAAVTLDDAFCASREGATPGPHVRLTISDTGSGMDAATLEHLFEPFYTTKDIARGAGLGLATAYGIVRQSGGVIDVTSTPGAGSVFAIYMPVDATPPAESEGPSERDDPQPPTGHETVLLVEDEGPVLRLTQRLLERLGYTVIAASTPSEALELARSHSGEVQLIVTDVVMPEMNGRALAREISAQRPEIRCLLISGYPAEITSKYGELDRAVTFLSKPFTIRELAFAARQALSASDGAV